jgi:RimJ/RimL family protein N-acetyltransferase
MPLRKPPMPGFHRAPFTRRRPMLIPFHPDYPIETERLRLRPFRRGDVDAVADYRSLPEVAKYLLDGPLSRETVTLAVQTRVAQTGFEAEGDKIFLAIERKDGTPMIGEVSLILRDLNGRQGEIGYILHPAQQRQGLATEAAAAMLALAFEGAGLHRVHARCAVANVASARLMERLGMRREAHFRQHGVVKGAWDEEFIYAILEDEWRAHRTP